MILVPPEPFDRNEWFIIAASLVSMLVMLLLKRRFPSIVIWYMFLFNFYLGLVVDLSIATTPLDLYDVNDSIKYEWFDVILYLFCYPPSAYVIIYFYDRWGLKGMKLVLYLIVCALITTGLEGLSVWAGVFHYKGWRLVYSFPVYIVVYLMNIGILGFIRKHLSRV